MSTNTEREELALDIFLADNGIIPEGSLLQDWADAPEQHRPYAYNIADGLIAKGYAKPRTITTAEELDALPDGCVILDRGCVAWQKRDAGNDPLWHAARNRTLRRDTGALAERLPATVLYEPEAEATR